jgi:hypothetical protein
VDGALDVAAGGVVGVTAGDPAGGAGSLPPQAMVTIRAAADTPPEKAGGRRRFIRKF